MLEEIQHWIATKKRRLTPRMKAHNAWQIDFKRDIPIQVFILFLKAVWKARSAFGVSYTQISIQYTEKKGLIRDLSRLGQITREAVREYLNQNFRRRRRGSANVICNKDKHFAIQHIRKISQVFVKYHYTSTNKFGFIGIGRYLGPNIFVWDFFHEINHR